MKPMVTQTPRAAPSVWRRQQAGGSFILQRLRGPQRHLPGGHGAGGYYIGVPVLRPKPAASRWSHVAVLGGGSAGVLGSRQPGPTRGQQGLLWEGDRDGDRPLPPVSLPPCPPGHPHPPSPAPGPPPNPNSPHPPPLVPSRTPLSLSCHVPSLSCPPPGRSCPRVSIPTSLLSVPPCPPCFAAGPLWPQALCRPPSAPPG